MRDGLDVSVIGETTRLSFEGKMAFPEVVRKLAGVGIERYCADLVRRKKTFYDAAGQSHSEAFPAFAGAAIAEAFSAAGVKAAIAASQKRQIEYPEFLREIMAAGTVSYSVYLRGRQAIYVGRQGDFHVENFPPAP